MAKITYYLGAGASFNSIPILNRLSEIMIDVAKFELAQRDEFYGENPNTYNFDDDELSVLPEGNREKILWYIGYFGKKGNLFNTIDTYARKLELTKDITKLDILKMCISVFFDLWENYHESRYRTLVNSNSNNSPYMPIDNRYKSLFSILLQNDGDNIILDENIKFISWNYDLQLESTFKLFLEENTVNGFDELNSNFIKFKENIDKPEDNNIFHLNGHRGFHSHFSFYNQESKTVEPNTESTIDDYWDSIDGLFDSTMAQDSNFNQYIKYAWEHDLNNKWIKKISEVLKNTEILVIIGYSFPPFNREIDQFLFSQLDTRKIKKIIYQSPTANKKIIENLFVNPIVYENKIEIERDNLDQFYLPNEYFIVQKPFRRGIIKAN